MADEEESREERLQRHLEEERRSREEEEMLKRARHMAELGIDSEEEYEEHLRQEEERQQRERRKEQAWNAARMAGGGALGAARGARDFAKGFTAPIRSRLGGDARQQRAMRKALDTKSEDKKPGSNRSAADFFFQEGRPAWVYWVYFLITLALHYFIVREYGNLEHLGWFLVAFISFMILIVGTFVWIRREDHDDIRSAMVVTCAAFILYILPALTGSFPGLGGETFGKFVSFVVVYMPAWPLFMAARIDQSTDSGIFHFLFGVYKLIVVLIVLFLLLSLFWDYGASSFAQVDIGNPVDLMSGFWAVVTESWESITGFRERTGQYIDRATDPMRYYTGRVEENEDVPLGVEIVALRPIEDLVNNDTRVIVHGQVRARQFQGDPLLGPEATIVPGCVVESDRIERHGAVDPPTLSVLWGTSGQFQCEFEPFGQRGSYKIVGSATFPFETWAYVTYTIVDRERARAIVQQGLDLHEQLDIKEEPEAIFTGGPVMLGMGGTSQPILIDLEEDQPVPAGTRIGITLDSNWRRGDIGHVDDLVLKVPEPFYIEEGSCDRGEPEIRDSDEEGYTTYVFENQQPDILTGYTSASCKLAANKGDRLSSLLSTDKSELTFIGVARYKFTVDEDTTVRVR